MVDGCVKTEHGYEKTIYSNCYNLDKLVLYYKTYESDKLTKIEMMKDDIDGYDLKIYNLNHTFNIIQGN